ncbi:MAG: Fic family protein [Bacteroidales bacterium]|nr:Fic family protein [Bacteroidales bacterium]MDD4669546.1 Fic family protein [Bacteroidales bacterium]
MSNSEQILDFIKANPKLSSSEISERAGVKASYATVRRELAKLVADGVVVVTGKSKSSRYSISPSYQLFMPVDIATYFEKEVDERQIIGQYNFELIPALRATPAIFTKAEFEQLNALQETFRKNISTLSENGYRSEMERLGIDLSWKSSQIEGNTYSLLETEKLLKEKETAQGKSKDEAVMLLNHKDALDFILDNPEYLSELNVAKLETIHSILIKELPVERNIRIRRVGITGTNYRPLDNEFQIREALEQTCELINSRANIFEKALLVLLLLSYIQPFNDGNKRTARIVSNAILIANNYCPISFRTVDSIDYKKAMLIFYEQNNIYAFKQIFIDQEEFAVKTYF